MAMSALILIGFFSTPGAALATAAGAAAVPLLIHLLNRRQYRVVDWAAMRFLQAAIRRTTRRLRLEQWLLLAVRTLLILLPVLAMAAATPWAERVWTQWLPNATGSQAFAGQTHHVLVLDASLSMSARGEAGTAFERAQSLAGQFVRRAQGGDGFSLILLASPPKVIVAGPANDPTRLVREIEELRPTHGRPDLAQTLQAVENAINRQPSRFARRAVYFLTDLQRSQWSTTATASPSWVESWQRLHAVADVAMVDVGDGVTDNVAVQGLSVDDTFITAGSQVALTATVHNFGAIDKKQLRVELLQTKMPAAVRPGMSNAPSSSQVVRQELVDVPNGGTATLSFPIDCRHAGEYRLDVKLPDDVLAVDDRRSISLNVRNTVPVLLVNGRPAGDALATATGWLAAALNPFPAQASSGQQAAAQPRVIDAIGLGNPDLQLDQYDCVYYCDVARPLPRDRDLLDAYVQRGGTVVFVLGPSCDAESYHQVLAGAGDRLLPVRLVHRNRSAEGQHFTLAADEDALRRPPLAAFSDDDDRAALMAARFREYWQIEPSPKAPPRRVLSFAPPATFGDALVYEWTRGRGRVILITSTVNTDWTSWPIAPSFPPFFQELLRATARSSPRRDLTVGEVIDEPLPNSTTATEAAVQLPDGDTQRLPLLMGEDTPRFRFNQTEQSGLYCVKVAGQPMRSFAVNPPVGSESDLNRMTADELPPTGTLHEPQVITNPADLRHRPTAMAREEAEPLPPTAGELGSRMARWLLLFTLLMLFVEPMLAWRYGSARGIASVMDQPVDPRPRRAIDRVVSALALVAMAFIAVTLLIVLHAAFTGNLLGYLPMTTRSWIEQSLGVPSAAAGEGTRWRLDRLPVFFTDPEADRWLVGGVAVMALAVAGWVYWQELRSATRLAGWPLVALRWGLVLLALLVLLPQLRMVFEREGWPDLVVLIDDSQSMSVPEETGETARKLAPGPLPPSRLQVAQALLDPAGRNWLARLSTEKQARLHVYHVSEQSARLAEIGDAQDAVAAAPAIAALQPTGRWSRLGDAVRSVLQEFRGAALAGVVIITDGITTDGDDLTVAGRHAARSGVPLYLVGLGDTREPKDIAVGDLRMEDVVPVGDRLIVEAKLTARGDASGQVRVSLGEKQGETVNELDHALVTVDPSGAPVKIRFAHAPREPGERIYVLSVPPLPGENDVGNNELARTVTVDEFKRTRVLYIEGRPRYDFRFVKTLFERETEAVRGNKSIDLKVLLLDADPDFSRQDRTVIEGFPASRDDLFAQFDAIILGDVPPDHPQLGEKRLQWLAEFVKEKGGGLLALAGPMAMPHAYRGTPLAAVLPVDASAARAGGAVRSAGFLPSLTAVGRSHPALRLAQDEQENSDVWSQLKPIFWSASGLAPKPAAEVLATQPPASGAGTGEPLIVQHFVGAGRVMLLGFEESWRWRFRSDEARFNQFWIQLVRYLARVRPSRAEIRLDRQTAYRSGEPIRVTVRFPEDKPAPAADAAVRVQLDRAMANGAVERQMLQLAAVPGARGIYETIVTRTPEGSYRLTLQGVDGRAPIAEARVLAPPGEMDRLRLNRSDMERAAQLSRGRYFSITDAEQLPDELPPLPRITLHQPRPPWPIWNTPLICLIGLSLLAGEWLGRKRQQLL